MSLILLDFIVGMFLLQQWSFAPMENKTEPTGETEQNVLFLEKKA